MRVWRIAQASVARDLSGVGGLYVSGRWHHVGHPIVYTSSTASLAALEVLVHVDLATAPADLCLLEIDVPDGIHIETCDPAKLTPRWQDYPPPLELQNFGTQWLEEHRSALLAVPSVILPMEQNYLLNPGHKDLSRIQIVDEHPFAYDPRLIKK